MASTIKVYIRDVQGPARTRISDALPGRMRSDVEWVRVGKKSELPQVADLAVDVGTAATDPKAFLFAGSKGCRTIYCLPEAGELFLKTLEALVSKGQANKLQSQIPTTIIDSSLYRLVAL